MFRAPETCSLHPAFALLSLVVVAVLTVALAVVAVPAVVALSLTPSLSLAFALAATAVAVESLACPFLAAFAHELHVRLLARPSSRRARHFHRHVPNLPTDFGEQHSSFRLWRLVPIDSTLVQNLLLQIFGQHGAQDLHLHVRREYLPILHAQRRHAVLPTLQLDVCLGRLKDLSGWSSTTNA